jgi:hypothetical protein
MSPAPNPVPDLVSLVPFRVQEGGGCSLPSQPKQAHFHPHGPIDPCLLDSLLSCVVLGGLRSYLRPIARPARLIPPAWPGRLGASAARMGYCRTSILCHSFEPCCLHVRIGSGVGLNSRGEPRAAGPLLLIFMNVMLLVESGSGRFRCSALVLCTRGWASEWWWLHPSDYQGWFIHLLTQGLKLWLACLSYLFSIGLGSSLRG